MYEKDINLIINTFVSYYKYSIFEYNNLEADKSYWGLQRDEELLKHYILFGEVSEAGSIINSINKYSSETGGHNLHITYILFSNISLVADSIKELKNYLDYFANGSTLILINEQEATVLYFDPQISEIASAVQGVLTNSKTKKEECNRKKIFTVTNIIMVINMAVFILTAYLSGNFLDSDTDVLIFLGAKHNALIRAGQYYRLITAMFLHGGIVHIALNMYALKSVGHLIENMYGKLNFTLIYLFSGIVSSLFSYYFSPAISVGASGAIFGLMGAALVLGIKIRNRIGKEFLSSILQVIAVNLIIGFGISNVDNFGHLGGLVGGLVLTSLLRVKK